MDKTIAQKIANQIYKDIFGMENHLTLEQLHKKFAFDIPSARQTQCSFSGKIAWSFSDHSAKVVTQKAVEEQFNKDGWMKSKKNLETMQDILAAWKEINYITASKSVNSTNVAESDSVIDSDSVFQSTMVTNSKNIIFGYNIFDCSNLVASRDTTSCSGGMRLRESLFSSGFELTWCNKVSSSMFIHDAFDLYECMFCSHIRSKKYCIANAQYEKEEYFRLKKMVIEWILKDRSE